MLAKVTKSFSYAADGIHTMQLKPDEVHDIDPERMPGLIELGVVVPFEGKAPPPPAELSPVPLRVSPKSANEDGTSRAQHVTSAAVKQAAFEALTPEEKQARLKTEADAKTKAEAEQAKAKAEAEAKTKAAAAQQK